MTRRNLLHAVIVAAVAVLAVLPGDVASADISKNVISAFRGQLVITKGELPDGKNDKDTIAKIKAAKLTELKGEVNGDVKMWTFNYAAFLSKTGATSLKLEFWKDGKQYAADKNLSGVDPKSSLLTGEISIDADENIDEGKSYVLKLVAGANTTVAQATLVMK
jgi:hypothetical protein